MRPLILATALLAALGAAGPAAAQSIPMPPSDFPETGTFCGPFTLCAPQPVSRDASQ